ncbi:hypothetical protein AB6A40_007145 [Gnathostoma spinigerum]|uniref:Uncharacterized protein n=1 Tax=Gnathostoma spinigerum TaxID=75299 RepID=A0ABD6EKZ4_9BILA
MRTKSTFSLWIKTWLIISTVLCTLDVIYTMFRPYTLRGEALGGLYYLWNIYSDVDLRYGEANDLVTMATGRVMVIEIVMNVLALIMDRRRSRHATLVAFTSSAFVLWKTLWYMALYIRTPDGTPSYIAEDAGCLKIFLVFWVPDGIWVIVPLLVMISLWDALTNNVTKITVQEFEDTLTNGETCHNE